MKRLTAGFVIGLLLVLMIAGAAQAAAPHSIQVYPGTGASLNQGPGDDQVPPQITIYTPQGEVNPTL